MSDQPVIQFHGAAGAVTGSCHLLEFRGKRILIDCGMFQGSKTEKELNYRAFAFEPRMIEAVILTHAHIDHSGLLPKLVKNGFDGPIYATRGTADLCSVMLPDSAHIQQTEVGHLNRRNQQRGRKSVDPIYTAEDAAETITHFRKVDLEVWQDITDGIRFRLWNAGHLLGSTSVEIEIAAEPQPIRILFSGDLGPTHKLLEFAPKAPVNFDYVVCESTYGDTDRIDTTDKARRKALRTEIEAAYHASGALIIPSFAVERTQELLADIFALMQAGEIVTCPVFIDSPLATRASEIFKSHAREIENGDLLVKAMQARNVRFTESVEQSKALDNVRGFHIVMAASGMCEAGRIRHRLRNWLWRDNGTVLLVGYQASGTLGRILLDGAETVRIQGDEIKVRARIRNLDIYSGHADGPELADWVKAREPIHAGIFLVHGEEDSIAGLQQRLAAFLPAERIYTPHLDAAYRLTAQGPVDISAPRAARLEPMHMGHRDWHNDFQSLVLDLQQELANAADDKARGVVIRKIRQALKE